MLRTSLIHDYTTGILLLRTVVEVPVLYFCWVYIIAFLWSSCVLNIHVHLHNSNTLYMSVELELYIIVQLRVT